MIIDLAQQLSTPYTTVAVLQRVRDSGTAGSGNSPDKWLSSSTPIISNQPARVVMEPALQGTLTTSDLAEPSTRRSNHGRADVEVDQMEPAARAREDRVVLLARKYEAGRISREESARLEILTQRIRRLDPRITVEDWERVIGVAEFMDREREDLRAFAEEFGLE